MWLTYEGHAVLRLQHLVHLQVLRIVQNEAKI